jgi:3-phenylpropionate/trans-cinnamate dioxygenase ferredoxin subunit
VSTGEGTSPAASSSGTGDAETIDLGDQSGLREGDITTCSAGELDVMVCRFEGKLYAIEDRCSHAETTLSDGLLIGSAIACPLHGASFDVRDGRHLGPPAYTGVRTFPVIEADGAATVVLTPPEPPEPDPGAPPMRFRTR